MRLDHPLNFERRGPEERKTRTQNPHAEEGGLRSKRKSRNENASWVLESLELLALLDLMETVRRLGNPS